MAKSESRSEPYREPFAWLKHKIDRQHPRTKEELKRYLLELWENIDPEFLKPDWSSMGRRCDLVNGKQWEKN